MITQKISLRKKKKQKSQSANSESKKSVKPAQINLISFHQQNEILAVFLDLVKAFNKRDYKILLNKLGHLRIRSAALNDSEYSDLNFILQVVAMHSDSFRERIIKFRLTQGSMLRPLLFPIYVNDLPSFVRSYYMEEPHIINSKDII